MTVLRFRSTPQHQHRCIDNDCCTWLGRHGQYDLYCCLTSTRGVVLIARYGDRKHDFATLSMKHYRGTPEQLTEPFHTVHQRARAAGVIT